MIEWKIGEISRELLILIVVDNSVTCAIYAKNKNLPETIEMEKI